MTPAARLLHGLTRALEWPARAGVVAAMAVLVVFSVGQVVDRYLLKTSFDAYDQIGRLGLVWLTFIGIALAVRERVNIRIELMEHFLPAGATRALSVLLDGVVLLTALYLIWEGWALLDVGSYQQVMGTPLTYEAVYAGLIVGLVLLSLFLLLHLGGRLAGIAPPAAAPAGLEAAPDRGDHHA